MGTFCTMLVQLALLVTNESTTTAAYYDYDTLQTSGELFVGPQRHAVVGFWPLDYSSRLRNIKDGRGPTVLSRVRLATESEGPFGELATSYCASSYFGSVHYDNLTSIDGVADFTLSFFFYKHDIEGEILSLLNKNNTGEASLLLKIAYLSDKIVVETQDETSLIDDFRTDEWIFYAVTYQDNAQLLTVHRPTGDVAAEFTLRRKIDKLGGDSLSLKLGKLNPNDRISCVLLYESVLLEVEIARLPCVCKTRGQCPYSNGKSVFLYKTKHFVGPKKNFLVGFWPLDKDNGVGESVNGLEPFVITRAARLMATFAGPFNQLETSYTTLFSELDSRRQGMAEYLLTNFSRTFTISFFFFVNDNSLGGEIARFRPVAANGEQLAAYFRLGYRPGRISVKTNGLASSELEFQVDCENNGWTFFALTYQSDGGVVAGYNVDGEQISSFSSIPIGDIDDGDDEEGVVFSFGRMSPYDRLSCLMLWSDVALAPSSISELPQVCQTATTVPLNGFRPVSTRKPRQTSPSPSTTSSTATTTSTTTKTSTTTTTTTMTSTTRTTRRPTTTTTSASKTTKTTAEMTLLETTESAEQLGAMMITEIKSVLTVDYYRETGNKANSSARKGRKKGNNNSQTNKSSRRFIKFDSFCLMIIFSQLASHLL